MSSQQHNLAVLRDRRGVIRAPHTLPGAQSDKSPGNKGRRYPPEAFKPLEAQMLFRGCTTPSKYAGGPGRVAGHRLRAACIVLWRTGLRVQELLDLEERDLDPAEQQITVRCGKGAKRRIVGMDPFGWQELRSWMEIREDLPPGPVFPVLTGNTVGAPWDQNSLRTAMRSAARRGGLRRRVNPHALRHTFAVEAWREGIDILTIQRQLGHSRLDVTQAYLVSLGADDLLTPVMERKTPMVPMSIQT